LLSFHPGTLIYGVLTKFKYRVQKSRLNLVEEGESMKYEYATVPLLTHATKQILDTWGSDGWELVQVIPAPGGGDQLVAYMKRAVQ
jgi:hypothetical protein